MEDRLEKEVKKTKDENRVSALKAVLAQLQTSQGIYRQPKLTDQIAYLNSMINRADQLPGKDAYERYDALVGQLQEIKDSLE